MTTMPLPMTPQTAPAALTEMRGEIARLQTDNDDLHASANLWARLYESAVARANELEARFAKRLA